MKIINLVFIFITLPCIISTAQNKFPKNVELVKDTSKYHINNKQISSLTYTFNNQSDDIIWLWINKNDVTEFSDYEKYKAYFNRRKDPKDMNLYQLGMDGDIGFFVSVVYETFLKRIQPRDYFTIQIISTENILGFKKQKIFSYLDKRVVILSEGTMSKLNPTITKLNECLFYKANIITLNIDELKF